MIFIFSSWTMHKSFQEMCKRCSIKYNKRSYFEFSKIVPPPRGVNPISPLAGQPVDWPRSARPILKCQNFPQKRICISLNVNIIFSHFGPFGKCLDFPPKKLYPHRDNPKKYFEVTHRVQGKIHAKFELFQNYTPPWRGQAKKVF